MNISIEYGQKRATIGKVSPIVALFVNCIQFLQVFSRIFMVVTLFFIIFVFKNLHFE